MSNAVSTRPTEASVLEAAHRSLQSNSHVILKAISCNYQDGTLSLRGSVPTYYLKQMAQELVVQLNGVEHIDNQIEVIRPAMMLDAP